MHIGGRRKKAKMTASDLKIIEAIRPKLNSDGLYFVGIDIVGNKLLEVNVFCPGGINNINELYGINVGRVVIQDLERQVRFRQMGLSTRRIKGKTAEWVVQ
jgi:glutathione synthase